MKVISIKERLPEEGKYILVHLTKDNWGEDKGQYWQVAKIVKGISIKEREEMEDFYRKITHMFGDEGMNNEVAYAFNSFGPSSYFGQEVDYWCELPKI